MNRENTYTVVRRINSHGGVTIPKFFREDLKLGIGDPVAITKTEDGTLTLRKKVDSCWFCGSVEKLRITKKGTICSKCFNLFKGIKVQ